MREREMPPSSSMVIAHSAACWLAACVSLGWEWWQLQLSHPPIAGVSPWRKQGGTQTCCWQDWSYYCVGTKSEQAQRENTSSWCLLLKKLFCLNLESSLPSLLGIFPQTVEVLINNNTQHSLGCWDFSVPWPAGHWAAVRALELPSVVLCL